MLNIVFAANESRFQMRVITWCPKCNQVKLFPSAALQKKKKKSPSNTLTFFFLTLTATECVDGYNHVHMCDPTKKKNKCKLLPPLTNKRKKPKVGGNPFCSLHLHHTSWQWESHSLPPDFGWWSNQKNKSSPQIALSNRLRDWRRYLMRIRKMYKVDICLLLAAFRGFVGLKCSGQPQSFRGDGWRLFVALFEQDLFNTVQIHKNSKSIKTKLRKEHRSSTEFLSIFDAQQMIRIYSYWNKKSVTSRSK